MMECSVQFAPNEPYRRLIGHPILDRVSDVGVYGGMILGHRVMAPNDTLWKSGFFWHMKQRGVRVWVETGATAGGLEHGMFREQLRDIHARVGDKVHGVSLDVPIAKSVQHANPELHPGQDKHRYHWTVDEPEKAARTISAYNRTAHQLGYAVNWIESLPYSPWSMIEPIWSRAWEIEPWERCTLDLNWFSTRDWSDDDLASFRMDLNMIGRWCDDRRNDRTKLRLGVTLISPSIPRPRTLRDRIRQGLRHGSWNAPEVSHRPCVSLEDFQACVREQMARTPFRPDYWDPHSWESAVPPTPDGYPKTLPSFDDHIELTRMVLRA